VHGRDAVEVCVGAGQRLCLARRVGHPGDQLRIHQRPHPVEIPVVERLQQAFSQRQWDPQV
jgi:hypothetical protein